MYWGMCVVVILKKCLNPVQQCLPLRWSSNRDNSMFFCASRMINDLESLLNANPWKWVIVLILFFTSNRYQRTSSRMIDLLLFRDIFTIRGVTMLPYAFERFVCGFQYLHCNASQQRAYFYSSGCEINRLPTTF